MGQTTSAPTLEPHNTTACTPEHGGSSHEAGGETAFIAALLLLVMITLSMNLAHYLKHKNFTYFGETAIYILFGIIHLACPIHGL